MYQTISILISGRVQGVWYRKHAQQKAIELSITGSVENQKDGTVKIKAAGAEAALNQLIEWCRKGPDKAVVEKVTVTQLPLQIFEDFKIIRHLFD
jgi:acylphosphatase